jgi:ATP-binding cassette, subfamily B, multidrug efflux pump
MFVIFKKIGWFIKQHWIKYFFAVLFLNLASLISVLSPKVLELGINQIVNKTLTKESLIELILYLILILVVGYIVSFLWLYLLYGAGNNLEYTIRKNFFRHLLRMDNHFYERYVVGDLMARSTSDLRTISMTAGYGILALVDSTVYLIFILAMMIFTIDLNLTLISLIPLPFAVLVVKVLGSRIHKAYTNSQNAFSEMNNKVLESVSGVRVVRAYVQEHAEIERLEESATKSLNRTVDLIKIDALFDPLFKTVFSIAQLIAFSYGIYLVFNQRLTPGELVAFSIYLGMLGWPLIALGDTVNIMQRGNASYDRIQEILSEESQIKQVNDPTKITRFSSLEVNNLTFRYPKGEFDVLKQIDFKLHRGQTLGLVGKTGSGKTTILRQLLKQYHLTTGEVLINGINVTDLETHEVRGLYGYVPQEHILFTGTVKENIAFGKANATDDEINQAIELADFRKDIEFLDQGLETIVGEQGVMLSGGQKQRLSIARAFVLSPEVLILDDSLSAVDGTTEKTILRNLKEARQGKTTIIVAHRLSAVEHADNILVLDQGNIVEQGNHQGLMMQNGWYAMQYRHQQMTTRGEE